MRKLTPDDKLSFGKNAGILLKEIYQFEPTYLEWLIINVDDIRLDIDAFEKLPDPTPVCTGAVMGSKTRKDICQNKDVLEILKDIDSVNMFINVNKIKELYKEKKFTPKNVSFRFSPEAKIINNKKLGL